MIKDGDYIKSRTCAAGAFGTCQPGARLKVGQDIDVETAKAMVDGNYAEVVDVPAVAADDQKSDAKTEGEKLKRERKSKQPEEATRTGKENAATRVGRKTK